MKRIIFFILLLSAFAHNLYASHIVGGDVTYKYIGSSGSSSVYEITIIIYQDCQNGQPSAIQDDYPVYLAIYDAATKLRVYSDSIIDNSFIIVPLNFSNQCINDIPDLCLRALKSTKRYSLPNNASGYTVAYQRCCRNGQIMNIEDPASNGATYTCTIPSAIRVGHNNSAIFKNYPPQIICLNTPLYYDHSATDPDPEDSLSYEFCDSYIGATTDDVKPFPPAAPPYSNVRWVADYSASAPIKGSPAIQINPVTGIITGTPRRLGRFLVTVCCHEWRRGVLINTTKREFQFVITDCSKAVVACIPQFSSDPNTYIIECKSYKVHFVNCSSGGFAYLWDFGVPGCTTCQSNDFEPDFTFPDTGIYLVKLLLNPGSTCPDSISRYVKIFPYFNTNFAFAGVPCPEQPTLFSDSSKATIKPVNYWHWNFGDGTECDSQNCTHRYNYGGTYNVVLISKNVKNCIDSAVKQVTIETFKPFAGKDTIIVKGEYIQFNATGGNQYSWLPATNLSNATINNPVGYYPDTGIFKYALRVISTNGCEGWDTITVRVVNEASFWLPNAFSPNGDGINDLFRPLSVGYKAIKYFRVYDRWGEQVYYSENLTSGWDGTYKDKKMEIGAYYWQIAYIDRYGSEGYLKGDVTLIR